MLHDLCIKLLSLLLGRSKVQNLREIIWSHPTDWWSLEAHVIAEEGRVLRDAVNTMLLAV